MASAKDAASLSDDLRAPLVQGHKGSEKTPLRLIVHLFMHPDSPRTGRYGKRFQWWATQFRNLVLFLVVTNLVLTVIGIVPSLNTDLAAVFATVNSAVIIPVSCVVFTAEYCLRIWSIPESSPVETPWRVRLLWAIHILPLLELFAVVMMWVSMVQMLIGSIGPQSANTAAVARAARGVRVLSKAARAARAAKTAAKASAAAGHAAQSAVIAGRKVAETKGSGQLRRLRSQQFVESLTRQRLSESMRGLLEKSDTFDLLEEDHDHSDHEAQATKSMGETVAEEMYDDEDDMACQARDGRRV